MQMNKWKREMPEVPETVHNAVMSTLEMIKTKDNIVMKGNPDMKNEKETPKNHTVKKIIRPLAALAACFALLLTAIAYGPQTNHHDPNGNQITEEGSALTNLAEMLPDFSITAYAAELDVAEASEGNIVIVDTGTGEGGYTGMMFRIHGEDISAVRISLDKGELYSATIENTTEDVMMDWLAQGSPDEDNNPDTHTIMRLFSQETEDENVKSKNVQLYHCAKKGTEIDESYSNEMYYGFYIPEQIVSSVDGENDLASAYHDMLEVFDGAKLKVTVTCNDGATSEKTYHLSVEKLMQDESGVITQEIWNGDDEGAFVYGILAKEETK